MELKAYQKNVMKHLESYLDCLQRSDDLHAAWQEYWMRQDINVGLGGVPAYRNAMPGVPHVCMKVPTGGGKTFMACAAVRRICDAMPAQMPRTVVWLVPSDSILTQTIRTLSDPTHPYRQRLDMDFGGKVAVYTKEQLLNGQNFSPDTVREMLTICIMSYASLRIDSRKKDVRKVYQENGNLKRFADYFQDRDVLLADTPDTALIQVLRNLTPVTIVDESHNAGSDLSEEMLDNLNPSFVLDLTATPRKNSNIIAYVDARELKRESMVKLPVIVYNRASRQSVIQDAIQLRGCIEAQAKAGEAAGGQYIRPIALFQAQPRIKGDSETFSRIKAKLMEIGIPEEQIAIKTADVDDLKNVDLMSRTCPIRYIITVNALKEGWDCPFAYVLASLANKSSAVEVEQILGRILRQPYAVQHGQPLLNTSYVLTCSNEFHHTLENIVRGLNRAGFSRRDFRVGETAEETAPRREHAPDGEQMAVDTAAPEGPGTDAFEDVSADEIREAVSDAPVEAEPAKESAITSMVRDAQQQQADYHREAVQSADDPFMGGELGDMLKQYGMQGQYQAQAKEVRIPQFYLKSVPDLFGDAYDLLQPENLSEGFSLDGADANISFELASGEMYSVDIQSQGEAVPKFKRISAEDSRYIREYLAALPTDKRIESCAGIIAQQLNRNDRYAASEVRDYVRRIIRGMSEDELTVMENALPVYARKIQEKIHQLESAYRVNQFRKWIDSGKIVCRDEYLLPEVITPADAADSRPDSLYEAEKDDLNEFESQAIDIILGLGNVQWWHRIIERGEKEFRLNGFQNHYPDFMVMTDSGNLVLIETKGDHLATEETLAKLELGRKWQAAAGPGYRYFMVFDKKNVDQEGAYTLDAFVEVMKEL